MCLVTCVREILRKHPYAFLRADAESGMTLIELMATVLIGGMVTLAVVYLWNAVDQLYQSVSVHASATTDTSLVYWELEKLAQYTEAVGTPNSDNPLAFDPGVPDIPGSTGGTVSVPVLALKVSSLKGIVPPGSSVYNTAANGFVCAAFILNPNNGMTELDLYPPGQPSNVTPLFSGVTSFKGSTFEIQGSNTFSVMLQPSVLSSARPTIHPSSITYTFSIGASGY